MTFNVDLPAPVEWARGRTWWWRAPILVWVTWVSATAPSDAPSS